MRRSLRRSSSGFTLIELIIVLAILFVACLMFLPRLFWYANRAKLLGAARATNMMIAQARMAALKGGAQARVVFDYTKGEVYAFVDTNGNGTYDVGTDRQLGDYVLHEKGKKTFVRFMRAGDSAPNLPSAIVGFDDPPYGGTCGGNGCIVFDRSGATQAGSVSFTDGYANFIEVRIKNSATALTELRKYHRTRAVYIVDALHTEPGSRSAGWDWYEDRDPNVLPP